MSVDAVLTALVAASGNPWAAWAVKATLAMLGALALLRGLRRASASARHLLASATFGVLLLLPLVSAVAPARVIEVEAPRARVTAPPAARAEGDAVRSGSAPARPARPPRFDGARAVLALYLGGIAVFALSLGLGVARLYRVRERGDVSVVGTRVANELARREGARDGIEVMTSRELAVPMTFGWAHPVILLPAETAAWNEEEMMRALRHEIEHVTRGDWATQLLARVAFAVYWPHPFAWLLWRRLRLEAERACDDAVIRSQGEAEPYAEQLVALARRVRDHGDVPALAMATRSNLGRRVEAILSGGLRRAPRSRPATATALTLVLLAVAAVAPVRLTQASAKEATADGDESGRSLDRSLFEASKRGELARMQRLLDAGAQAGAVLPGDGTPLIAAARNGRLAAIDLLYGAGADVNRGVAGDGSPLIAAAQAGHLEAVRLLLARGAAIDAGVPGDGNALIMAAGSGHVDVVRFLLDQGAGIETVVPGDENALIHASESGQVGVVRLLIERGADVNARVPVQDPLGRTEWRTPLSMARRGGHADVVRILQAAGARE